MFLDNLSLNEHNQSGTSELDSALFDEFTSLVFSSCYKQIWLLMNVHGLRLYGDASNIKTPEKGRINTYMQRLSIFKAGAIARPVIKPHILGY